MMFKRISVLVFCLTVLFVGPYWVSAEAVDSDVSEGAVTTRFAIETDEIAVELRFGSLSQITSSVSQITGRPSLTLVWPEGTLTVLSEPSVPFFDPTKLSVPSETLLREHWPQGKSYEDAGYSSELASEAVKRLDAISKQWSNYAFDRYIAEEYDRLSLMIAEENTSVATHDFAIVLGLRDQIAPIDRCWLVRDDIPHFKAIMTAMKGPWRDACQVTVCFYDAGGVSRVNAALRVNHASPKEALRIVNELLAPRVASPETD